MSNSGKSQIEIQTTSMRKPYYQDADILDGFCLEPLDVDGEPCRVDQFAKPPNGDSNEDSRKQTDSDIGDDDVTNLDQPESIKVLLIDDDRFWSDKIASALIAFGFRVSTALDGVVGLDKVKTFRPDVIVCDTAMPRMNGLEFICQLREQNDDTPVVLASDVVVEQDDPLLLNLGANKHISKSKDPQLLVNAIRDVRDVSQRKR